VIGRSVSFGHNVLIDEIKIRTCMCVASPFRTSGSIEYKKSPQACDRDQLAFCHLAHPPVCEKSCGGERIRRVLAVEYESLIWGVKVSTLSRRIAYLGPSCPQLLSRPKRSSLELHRTTPERGHPSAGWLQIVENTVISFYKIAAFSGAPGGTRTPSLLIRSSTILIP
jgi:hypothetical protein